jgi:sulfate adenylyltransferase large subunit
MATGASNADLAILLLDASRGIQPQSKRHACILGLLGIRHLVVLVNKLDLVGYSEQVFRSLQCEFSGAVGQLEFETIEFFPVSASLGTNVVHRSSATPWFRGPALLEYLENVDVNRNEDHKPLRLPVQLVQRTHNFRGYSGQIGSGRMAIGDSVTVLPSLRSTRIKSIVSFSGDLDEAIAPQSVTVTVEDEIDISRGDLLVDSQKLPFSSRNLRAQIVWFSEQPLAPQRRYLLKHTTQVTPAEVAVESVLDINSLASRASQSLRLNDIGTVRIETVRTIFFDSYRRNRGTGSFILIDPATNNTVAAGMIVGPAQSLNETVEERSGIVVSIGRNHPMLEVLKRGGLQTQNVAVLSHWNRKAVDLLSQGGMHVVVIDAPPEIQDITHDSLELLLNDCVGG